MVTSNTYKRNDTGPPVSIVCLDGDSPIDLTNATSARFLMGQVNAAGVSTIKVQGTAAIATDKTTGTVTYNWVVGDLDTVGTYSAEVEITWTTGKKQTFPAANYLTILVVADIG